VNLPSVLPGTKCPERRTNLRHVCFAPAHAAEQIVQRPVSGLVSRIEVDGCRRGRGIENIPGGSRCILGYSGNWKPGKFAMPADPGHEFNHVLEQPRGPVKKEGGPGLKRRATGTPKDATSKHNAVIDSRPRIRAEPMPAPTICRDHGGGSVQSHRRKDTIVSSFIPHLALPY
jgi:hypothetical protein